MVICGTFLNLIPIKLKGKVPLKRFYNLVIGGLQLTRNAPLLRVNGLLQVIAAT